MTPQQEDETHAEWRICMKGGARVVLDYRFESRLWTGFLADTRRPLANWEICAAAEIAGITLPLLNAGLVSLLDNQRLVNQLCQLERRTGGRGRDTIDHPPNGKDDLINSAMGAVDVAWTTDGKAKPEPLPAWLRPKPKFSDPLADWRTKGQTQ